MALDTGEKTIINYATEGIKFHKKKNIFYYYLSIQVA
jgi:hypothetical protein